MPTEGRDLKIQVGCSWLLESKYATQLGFRYVTTELLNGWFRDARKGLPGLPPMQRAVASYVGAGLVVTGLLAILAR